MSDAVVRTTKASVTRFGWLAFIGPALSLTVCYAKVISSAAGVAKFEINPHWQAILMWMFALLAVYGLSRDRSQHGQKIPFFLGLVGFVIIVGTLYTYYKPLILVLGYIVLIVAAFLNQHALLRGLYDTVAELNTTLEQRVADQVAEISGLARLKRFLAPELAELITKEGKEYLLESHRRFITAVFCDLRGFTAFSDGVEPEEVIGVLQIYHERLGRLVVKHGGTIHHRAGDGLMVVFNDPMTCDEPVLKAVRLAIEMRQVFLELNSEWEKRGYDLGFGIGIASGHATLGVIGSEDRQDYTAIGNPVNLAARLCGEAKNGQILLSQKAYADVENCVDAQDIGELQLKGVGRPIKAFNVVRFVEERRTAQDGVG